jgi:hypothetical protein
MLLIILSSDSSRLWHPTSFPHAFPRFSSSGLINPHRSPRCITLSLGFGSLSSSHTTCPSIGWMSALDSLRRNLAFCDTPVAALHVSLPCDVVDDLTSKYRRFVGVSMLPSPPPSLSPDLCTLHVTRRQRWPLCTMIFLFDMVCGGRAVQPAL